MPLNAVEIKFYMRYETERKYFNNFAVDEQIIRIPIFRFHN